MSLCLLARGIIEWHVKGQGQKADMPYYSMQIKFLKIEVINRKIFFLNVG